MNGERGDWAAVETWQRESDAAEERSAADVIQVVLSWCDAQSRTVLGVTQVTEGGTLSLGEGGELLVPEEALGASCVEMVRYEAERAVAIAPPGSRVRVDGWDSAERSVEIASGHVVEILFGAFVVRLARVPAGHRAAAAPLEELRKSGAGFIAGSALAHFAVFAAVALFTPALGATEEDPYDADRLALMQRLLNAHAAPEAERRPEEANGQTGGDANAGQPARGAEGAAGKPEIDPSRSGRWAARGSARPEDATLPRERVLAEAAAWPTLGMLASLGATGANVPVVPWGTTLNGADDANAVGRLYGGTIGDAFGAGGQGMFGLEEGGGGRADVIGLGDLAALGHTGSCLGNAPCDGIGHGIGKPGTPHVPRPPALRYAKETQVNGHLPAEVIQRIVRQNDGRYRFCYAKALTANPNLQGRVTVRFLIDRSGGVALAADAGSDLPDEGVRNCVVRSFQTLSFPAPDSGMVTVVYPLVFSPE